MTPSLDRSDAPESVTVPARTGRRGALARLLGAAGATVAAAALPAVAEAHPAPAPALPDWLADRPDWFAENVERYARALAELSDPLGTKHGLSHYRTRQESVVFWAECMIEGMNLPPREYAPEPPRPREVSHDRIVTVELPRLDRNERRRVRRWLAARPTGASDPRLVLRLGDRWAYHREEREHDYLHVVLPPTLSMVAPAPTDRATAVVAEMIGAAKLLRGRQNVAIGLGCAHRADGLSAYSRTLYEWPDGAITKYARRFAGDAL